MKKKVLLSLIAAVLGSNLFTSSVVSAATNLRGNVYTVNNSRIYEAPYPGMGAGGSGITPGHTYWG